MLTFFSPRRTKCHSSWTVANRPTIAVAARGSRGVFRLKNGQANFPANAGQAEQERNQKTDQGAATHIRRPLIHQHEHGRPEERRGRVQARFPAEHDRDFVGQHVAQDAAHHAGDHAHHDRGQRRDLEQGAFLAPAIVKHASTTASATSSAPWASRDTAAGKT